MGFRRIGSNFSNRFKKPLRKKGHGKHLSDMEREYDSKGYFTKEDGTRVTHEPHYYYGKRQYDRPSKRR